MTTHTITDASLRTILWFDLKDGPTTQWSAHDHNHHGGHGKTGGDFVVDLASVIIDTTASEPDKSQWSAYLAGDTPEGGRIQGMVVQQENASEDLMTWLGPLVEETKAKHEAALEAMV
jgi:hypothetical protein